MGQSHAHRLREWYGVELPVLAVCPFRHIFLALYPRSDMCMDVAGSA